MSDEILARHTQLLESLNAHAERTDRRIGAILKQLRIMNESLIRTMTVRAELDDLRARVAKLEAAEDGGA
jgi:polyhydroxyalkanoate synthesis regulator phasin